MPLDDYRRKRRFDQTPEPPPAAPSQPPARPGGVFCVQRHHARQLHYDLRIEVGGVLKSWAVPKGPTLDPREKRMAVLVEDHPLEYAAFEGVIPPGNYGAGSMMLWDHGRYEIITETPVEEQLARGDFKFRLTGKKLRGDFVLVRGRAAKPSDWLLIKKKDAHAVPGWDLDAHAYSVLTGRTQEEIARQLPVRSERPPAAAPEPVPANLTPMMAQPATAPPTEPGWLFEVKWDGVRALCFLDEGRVRLVSRNGNPMDRQYPELSVLAAAVDARTAVLDGEIVALDEQGAPRFGLLQRRMHLADAGAIATLSRSHPVVLYLFDLIYLDGEDLRRQPVERRRARLAQILTPNETIRLSDAFPDMGRELLEAARQRGLEGIVAKRMGSPYESRRSPDWLKVKIVAQQEFVICGYTTGEREPFRALVLGLFDNGGGLRYVGNVGSGFDQQMLETVAGRMQPLAARRSPFAEEVKLDHPVTWLRPELVCAVRYASWTDEGRLRAPVFLGLRLDVEPRECVRENSAAPAAAPAAAPVWSPPPPLLAPDATEATLTVDGKRLKFTNLNKVYYPHEGYTKRDVIEYYHAVADLLLPHLEDRPLSLRRYPDGITGESFFQKDAAGHFPSWLRVEPVFSEHNQAPIRFVVADDRASLLYLANLGCIDQNPWMSRAGSLENPDFLLIDLDPQNCGYDRIVEAAQLVRRKLDALELEGYPKTTGGDGMHIYVPVEPVYTYEQARGLVEVLARLLAAEHPGLFTTPRAVSRRERGKVYFDWMQVSSGKTISAPYVLRAYPGAPVATPLAWREVRAGLTPQQFHLRNALDRFARVGDLFEGVLKKPQRLEGAIANLDRLVRNGA